METTTVQKIVPCNTAALTCCIYKLITDLFICIVQLCSINMVIAQVIAGHLLIKLNPSVVLSQPPQKVILSLFFVRLLSH